MLQGLSEVERAVLRTYIDPAASGISRAVRLSLQYATSAGIFVFLAIWQDNPLWSLAVYAIFLLFMAVRLVGARRIAGIMPGIIRKYEERISALEIAAGDRSAGAAKRDEPDPEPPDVPIDVRDTPP
jgi:hypothetical protein